MPGGRSTALYRPSPSVTMVRTFSMSAGLVASTVTPGRTAPDESRTTPATPLVARCAHADGGTMAVVHRAMATMTARPVTTETDFLSAIQFFITALLCS